MTIIVPAKTLILKRKKHGGQLAKDKKVTDPGTHSNSQAVECGKFGEQPP